MITRLHQNCKGVHKNVTNSPLNIFVSAYTVVDPESQGTDDQGDAEDHQGEEVVFLPHGVSAHGGGDHRGDPGHGGDEQPLGQRDIGEAGEVGEEILWRAGNKENQENKEVPAGAVVEKTERVDLFLGKEDLHQQHSKAADQEEDQCAADGNTQHTEKSALPDPEGVACPDFQRFTGNNGDDDLQDHHPQKGETSPDPMAVHPVAEELRLVDKADHGSADPPSHRQSQQEEEGEGGPGQKFFAPLGPVVGLFHRGSPFRPDGLIVYALLASSR